MARFFSTGNGQLVQISEAEFYELMFAPANGVYDEKFRQDQRAHEARVRAKYDLLPNRGLEERPPRAEDAAPQAPQVPRTAGLTRPQRGLLCSRGRGRD